MSRSSAISVQGLGKRYQVGAAQPASRSLRDALSDLCAGPYRRLRALARKQSYEALGLSKSLWVLQDVNFDVGHGEVVGIIGHNGSGKSTLLKILSRITTPTCGSALVRGRVASLLEVGTGFHPELTGRENVMLNGSILGMSRREIQRQFDEIVAFADVTEFIDTPVKHYSSGMYVRLAFSVAAHLEPEILIVDEVLAVGDVRFQKKCLNKMEDISATGRTVLFVSHNLSAVQSLCQRAIHLDRGQLVAQGPVADVVSQYVHSCAGAGCVQRWEDLSQAPGNRSCRVHAVEAVGVDEDASSCFPISQPIRIRIHYEVLPKEAHVSFGLTLVHEHGSVVFSSLNNLDSSSYGYAVPRGSYIAECVIPGNTLNDSSYLVSVAGYGPQWSDPFNIPAVIAIETTDDGVLRGDYFGRYGGCIRPCLEWSTQEVIQPRTSEMHALVR